MDQPEIKTKLVLKQRTSDESQSIFTLGSFDIGTKNLGVCVVDRLDGYPGFRIRKWKLISLVSDTGKSKTLKCKTKYKSRITKKMETCGKRPTFWNPTTKIGYCKLHVPKETNNTDEELNTDGELNIERYTTCRNITDFELNRKLIQELDLLPELWKDCHEVVVESQMQSSMRKISDMIFSYLVDRTVHQPDCQLKNVRKVNACKKLNIPLDKLPMVVPEGSQDEYNDRKQLAEKQCQALLRYVDKEWRDYYYSQKKQDDLADAFLQGLYFLLKKNR